MGRALRVTPGDTVYHVLNRANGRQALFDDEGDYAAFARVLAEAQQRVPMRLLAAHTMGSGMSIDLLGDDVTYTRFRREDMGS